MDEYTVTISENPLGVSFVVLPDTNTIALHEVAHDSHGFKLGLNIGDVLVAINNHSLHHLKPAQIAEAFNNQRLPFEATFACPSSELVFDDDIDDDTSDVGHNYRDSDEETDIDSDDNSLCSISSEHELTLMTPSISPFQSEDDFDNSADAYQ